jgi:hypothetical protein
VHTQGPSDPDPGILEWKGASCRPPITLDR